MNKIELNDQVNLDNNNSINEKKEESLSFAIQILKGLEDLEHELKTALPNFVIQDKADQLGRYIEETFAPLNVCQEWLEKNSDGTWYRQLALFLAKIPLKSACHIVQMLYGVIKGILFSAVHPLQASIHLAKQLAILTEELKKASNWSKIGASMIGAGFGQSLASGNSLSVIGIGIGSALVIAGFTLDLLQILTSTEKNSKIDAIKEKFIGQTLQISEIALTSFCTGLITGGVQKALYQYRMKTFRVKTIEEVKQHADSIITDIKNKFYNPRSPSLPGAPITSGVAVDPSGKITIQISSFGLDLKYHLKKYVPNIKDFYKPTLIIDLEPELQNFKLNYTYYSEEYYTVIGKNYPLSDLGITERLYPLPKENTLLSQYGFIGALPQASHNKK